MTRTRSSVQVTAVCLTGRTDGRTEQLFLANTHRIPGVLHRCGPDRTGSDRVGPTISRQQLPSQQLQQQLSAAHAHTLLQQGVIGRCGVEGN